MDLREFPLEISAIQLLIKISVKGCIISKSLHFVLRVLESVGSIDR